MVRPFLSVVIPAYNEASRLPLTLIDVDRHLSAQEFSSEIVVVVSPSTDNTMDIVKRFQSIIKNLRIMPLIENQGRGFAVRQGMLAAKGTYRLMMDADNSTTLIEFAKMIPYLTGKDEQRYDIAIGSRHIPGSHSDPPEPPVRRLGSSLGRWLIRTALVRGIADTGCGFKCFSSQAAEAVFSTCTANGWAIDAECLAIAQRLGYRIKEVPVFWAFDPGSHRAGRGSFGEHLSVWARLVSGRKTPAKK